MPNENTKRIIIDILHILEEYSDENHTLTQKDIIDLLYKEHNIVVDRKTVKWFLWFCFSSTQNKFDNLNFFL